jgi:hypothetical protein
MTDLELKEKRLVFLEETASFYNLANRSTQLVKLYNNKEDMRCVYRTSDGRSCAIGRHISDELAIELDKFPDPSISHSEILDKLPDELKNLGKHFLFFIQDLHDRKSYWSEIGLSSLGEIRLMDIKKDFKLI